MKGAKQNEVRSHYIEAIKSLFDEEDIEMIASNSFNFPIVVDEEEAWVEVVVKIPKEDEGYEKREEYALKCAEAKAKKIERDKKAHEARMRNSQPRKEEPAPSIQLAPWQYVWGGEVRSTRSNSMCARPNFRRGF